ncbi:MAG: BrnA antitoxin family protein [Bacteriovoracaceae bacterium]
MKTEYDLDKMKRREKIKITKDIKVSKTIRIDADVLMWLQDKAEEEGVGYQTFLNSFLKKAMRSENDKFEEIFKRIKKLENKIG